MRKQNYKWSALFIAVAVMVWICALGAMAGEGSNDNSLADLGILTEGAEVFPEFTYGVTEYEVRVPAGTQQLELDPVPTNGNAWIVDITGTELVDGETTVEITVEAENGERYPYHLHVTESGAAAVQETEPVPQTEPETEPEPETEDPRYVKVDRTTLQEAENTINALKEETRSFRERSMMLLNLLYGLIAVTVVLLFIAVNQFLKKRDLKAALKEYKGYGYSKKQTDGGYPQDNGGHGYENQERRGQGYSDQNYGRRDYANQSDAGQNYEYERESYDMAQQPQRRYGNEPAPQSGLQRQGLQPEPPVKRDDPATVPKPQKAGKRQKKMPEYEQPQPQEQKPQRKGKSGDVEITMIDL